MMKRNRKWKKTIILIVLVITLVSIPTIYLTAQIKTLMKYQTDTLNTLMEIEKTIHEYNLETGLTSLTDNEIESNIINRELIWGVVAAEARGDTLDGMIAVAQTIKDRGDLWGMSYEEVVLAKGQYAEPYLGTISDEVKLAVELVFDCGYRVSDKPITHFHSCGIDNEPYWAENKICRGTLNSKAHLFYY